MPRTVIASDNFSLRFNVAFMHKNGDTYTLAEVRFYYPYVVPAPRVPMTFHLSPNNGRWLLSPVDQNRADENRGVYEFLTDIVRHWLNENYPEGKSKKGEEGAQAAS